MVCVHPQMIQILRVDLYLSFFGFYELKIRWVLPFPACHIFVIFETLDINANWYPSHCFLSKSLVFVLYPDGWINISLLKVRAGRHTFTCLTMRFAHI